jgi:hypothetical protein
MKRLVTLLLITYILLEFAVLIIDPLGRLRLYETNRRVINAIVSDETTHYRLPPGQHHLNGWQATINAQGRRHVPQSDYWTDCVVVFLGDSFTFGQGVNDSETLPNLYAQDHDGVVVNTGMFGYGASQVNHTWQRVRTEYDVDGVFWLIMVNDTESPRRLNFERVAWHVYSPLWRYRSFSYYQFDEPFTDSQLSVLHQTIADIESETTLRLLALDEPLLHEWLIGQSVIWLPTDYEKQSPSDYHPTAKGYEYLYEAAGMPQFCNTTPG